MLSLLIAVLCILTGQIQALECTPPFSPVGNQCLYFGVLILENHSNARAVCQSLGGHLARVYEAQQLKDIKDYAIESNYRGTSYWLDGTDIEQEGHWVYLNGDEVPMGTPFWNVDHPSTDWRLQPDNGGGRENCLHINPSGYLNDVGCNASQPILCEEDYMTVEENKVFGNSMDISCPSLFVPVSEGLCLAFLTFADQTWAEGSHTCSSLGGQLAKIDQPQQLRDIYLYIHQQGLSEDSFWIGGSDNENEDVWLFNDKSSVPSGIPFWGIYNTQEPDGGTSSNCLVLNAPGQYYFRDDACDSIYNPLCSIDPL